MSEAPGHEMPFLDHLEELRKRLFWIAGAILLGIVVGFALLSRLDAICTFGCAQSDELRRWIEYGPEQG